MLRNGFKTFDAYFDGFCFVCLFVFLLDSQLMVVALYCTLRLITSRDYFDLQQCWILGKLQLPTLQLLAFPKEGKNLHLTCVDQLWSFFGGRSHKISFSCFSWSSLLPAVCGSCSVTSAGETFLSGMRQKYSDIQVSLFSSVFINQRRNHPLILAHLIQKIIDFFQML